MKDPFPPSEFDPWAETYDQDVVALDKFPFAGYERVLNTVVRLAGVRSGMKILDIGTGTGNLAQRFAKLGCELWCTDFSTAMLVKAREKLPGARFILHDFREDWQIVFEGKRFNRIVSAYVFHHVVLNNKVDICLDLVRKRLDLDGKLIVADLSFQTRHAKEKYKQQIEDWDEEPYWIADESISALEETGLQVRYLQVSACAGVYTMWA